MIKATYKGKRVNVTKLVLAKSEYINRPILSQVRIEYRENGATFTDYANANEVEFD